MEMIVAWPHCLDYAPMAVQLTFLIDICIGIWLAGRLLWFLAGLAVRALHR